MQSRSSFGTIVAVLGSCLVALGVAWLVAQNWQSMAAPLKVLVLAVATFGALAAAVLLRQRGYAGVGAALLVLASLLFSLSVFLVAQIFSTDVGLQGNAWLTALAVVGVLAIAYGLDSRASLVVGLSGVLVWLLLQFLAVASAASANEGGLIALLFLGAGLLFYALKLLHRERFSSLYRVWTVLYLLLFGYVLSFQSLLTLLGARNVWDRGTAFVTAVWAAALALAAVAWVRNRGGAGAAAAAKREAVVAAAVFAALLLVLFACRWVAGEGLGSCRPQPCWQLAETVCESAPACDWGGRRLPGPSPRSARHLRRPPGCRLLRRRRGLPLGIATGGRLRDGRVVVRRQRLRLRRPAPALRRHRLRLRRLHPVRRRLLAPGPGPRRLRGGARRLHRGRRLQLVAAAEPAVHADPRRQPVRREPAVRVEPTAPAATSTSAPPPPAPAPARPTRGAAGSSCASPAPTLRRAPWRCGSSSTWCSSASSCWSSATGAGSATAP